MIGLEPLIPIALFFSVAGIIVLKGPIGKAIADRIGGRATPPTDGGQETGALLGELEEVRYRLAEVEERLDFTERVMAQRQQVGELPRGD